MTFSLFVQVGMRCLLLIIGVTFTVYGIVHHQWWMQIAAGLALALFTAYDPMINATITARKSANRTESRSQVPPGM